MIHVDQECLDTKRTLCPSQSRGQREGVAAAGEPDNDPVPGCEPGGACPGQNALL